MQSSRLPNDSEPALWKTLYKAALFETDKTKILERIQEAQAEILSRRRIVMSPAGTLHELRAMDTALLSLQALANCVLAPSRMLAVRRASLEAQQSHPPSRRANRAHAA